MRGRDYRKYARDVGNPSFRKALISVHGMKTTGAWQKEINVELQEAGILHDPIDYGYALLSVFRRKKADDVAQKIAERYEHLQLRQPELRIAAIGHSFGTLSIGRALQMVAEIRFERVVLYASILSRKYPWGKIARRGQVLKVLNETCKSDKLPKVARVALRGPTGSSGCHGFKDPAGSVVHSREYEWAGHSGLGTAAHCRDVWIPFILNGKIPRTTS
jgi:hypothetical protein